MAQEFSRGQRIADFLRKELGMLIQKELRDPRLGLMSVTDVEVSRDLSHAKVFVTVMGKETPEESKEAVKALNGAAGFLRTQVARTHSMRTTPALKFVFDDSVNRGSKISRLIDEAVKSDRLRNPDED